MLGSTHLHSLKSEKGVEPWTFEQHDGEGVFIPAGCPHQVCPSRSSPTVGLQHVFSVLIGLFQYLAACACFICSAWGRFCQNAGPRIVEYHPVTARHASLYQHSGQVMHLPVPKQPHCAFFNTGRCIAHASGWSHQASCVASGKSTIHMLCPYEGPVSEVTVH